LSEFALMLFLGILFFCSFKFNLIFYFLSFDVFIIGILLWSLLITFCSWWITKNTDLNKGSTFVSTTGKGGVEFLLLLFFYFILFYFQLLLLLFWALIAQTNSSIIWLPRLPVVMHIMRPYVSCDGIITITLNSIIPT